MQSGKLDRLMTLQSLTPTTNITGEAVNGWTDFATVWASKNETPMVKSTEGFEAVQLTEKLVTLWEIRWLPGLNTRMRINSEGQYYEIQNIGEIPRRRGWTITSTRKDSDIYSGGGIGGDLPGSDGSLLPLDIKTEDYTALISDAFRVIPFDCTLKPLTCRIPGPGLTTGLIFRPVKVDDTGNPLTIICQGGGIINLGEGLFINNQQDAVALQSTGSIYVTFV